MDGQSPHAAGIELHGDPVRTSTGSTEHQSLAVLADQLDGHRDPLLAGNAPKQVRDIRVA